MFKRFPLPCFLATLLLLSGCDAIGAERTWHQKQNWRAEDYFQDPQVIALCKAIESNDLVEMKRLIDKGADVKALGKGNMTPLLWAFPDNKPERFRLLLEKGADPNVYTKSNFGVPNAFLVGDSVTHMAARSDFSHFDAVFELGGDANLPSKIETNLDETPIFSVIKAGGPDVNRRIGILIKKGADINHCAGTRPVILAASFGGQYDLALFLLENGADFKLYQADDLMKLTHILVRAQSTLLKFAEAQQRADYDRLVKFLEDQGETLQEAHADEKRWASMGGSIRNNYEQRKQEIVERKKREAAAKENKPLPGAK